VNPDLRDGFCPTGRVGPLAQQHPGAGVVQHQHDGLDADADQLPADDLGGEQSVRAEADQAAMGDRPFDFQGLAAFDGWQRGRPGRNAISPLCNERGVTPC